MHSALLALYNKCIINHRRNGPLNHIEFNMKQSQPLHSSQPSQSQHYTKAIVAGCISSSFCILQVILNILSNFVTVPISSGRLNTIFGPIRPFTRSLTLGWLITSWFSIRRIHPSNKKDSNSSSSSMNEAKAVEEENKNKQSSRKTKFLSTILCLVLMYMPEGLKFLGGPAVAPPVNNNIININIHNNNNNNKNNSNILQLDYTVDNMDCNGCVIEVEGLLSSQSGVISAKVTQFDLGEVKILVNIEWIEYEKKGFFENMNQVLVSHGFALHERGYKTQKMKFDESFATAGSGSGSM